MVFKNMYTKKILCVKDKKLAEFNCKEINNILPCNVNFTHWRKSDTEMCNIQSTEKNNLTFVISVSLCTINMDDFLGLTGVTITLAEIVIGNKLNLPYNLLPLVSFLPLI